MSSRRRRRRYRSRASRWREPVLARPEDIEAARKLGIETAALITGGSCEQELRDARAAAVYDSLLELRHLDERPFV